MHTHASLVRDLRTLGLESGSRRPVVVHSALRAVGPVTGGADTLLDALAETLGKEGTLLFPNLNIPHEFTASNPPRFDLQHDSVRKSLGILPQRFKEARAVHFSRHPTHAMMGAGPLCNSLFRGHEHAGLCCGPGTPWWRLAEAEGQILLVGVTQQNNTSIHGPEEHLATYQLSSHSIDGVVVDRGVSYRVRSRLHRWGNASDFSRINPALEKAGGLRRGMIGDAPALLVEARLFQQAVCTQLIQNERFLLL